MVCLAIPPGSPEHIWEENEKRLGMKELVYRLPDPDRAWRAFL